MKKLTQTLFLLVVASLFVAACSNNEESSKKESNESNEAKAQINDGKIEESYDTASVDNFKISLLKTSVKDDVLTLHLKVKNTGDEKQLFDAFVLSVKNADGKNLTAALDENMAEQIKPGESSKGIVSFTAAGKGPFSVKYDNLEGTQKELWIIKR
jgi:ABC-type enterochelin transport system substrate-binding protein